MMRRREPNSEFNRNREPLIIIGSPIARSGLFCLHPQQLLTICISKNVPGREGIVSRENLDERFKNLVFWIQRQTLQTNSLIGVQGDCAYSFTPSCGKWF